MEMTPVESSNIKEIGYDTINKTLGITFNRGDFYEFYDVPENIFEGLKEVASTGGSVGKYFNSEVRGKFEYENLGPV